MSTEFFLLGQMCCSMKELMLYLTFKVNFSIRIDALFNEGIQMLYLTFKVTLEEIKCMKIVVVRNILYNDFYTMRSSCYRN